MNVKVDAKSVLQTEENNVHPELANAWCHSLLIMIMEICTFPVSLSLRSMDTNLLQ